MLNKRCHHSDSTTPTSTTISTLFQVSQLVYYHLNRSNILIILTNRLDSNISDIDALHLAGGMVFLNGFGVLTINQLFMNGYHNGMKVRVAVCSLMYRKVFHTSHYYVVLVFTIGASIF